MLYNIHRPTTFSQVIGQPSAIVLRNFATGVGKSEKKLRRVPHSFLLSGTRGVGKTTIARLFALALNCHQADGDLPCGKCNSCRRGKNHPDIQEIDSASQGSMGDVQALIEQMAFMPKYRFRVYIFDEAQMLTKQAMASLLKIMEEPPRRAIILLLTTEPDKIDRALRSRCTWLRLRNLSQKEVLKLLVRVATAEEMRIEKDAVIRIAQYANGSARDALSVLQTLLAKEEIRVDDVEQVVGRRADVTTLLGYLHERNLQAALKEVNRLAAFYEPEIIADSAAETLILQMNAALEVGQPVTDHVNWVHRFKACRKVPSHIPQLPLELAVVECAMDAKFVPPPEIMLSDWKAFVAYVKKLNMDVALTARQLEYVRIRKGGVVVCRTNKEESPSLRKGVEAVQKYMQKYLRDKQLTLEVLYAD